MIFLFDLVFQSGDFYSSSNFWLDLAKTILGAAIGSGATLFALYRKFKFDSSQDEAKKILFQKQKIKYLQSLVKNINKNLEDQIQYFKKLSDDIKDNPDNLPLLHKSSLNSLTRLVHKVDQEDYYHSYLGEFGTDESIIDEFRKITSFLDYIDGKISEITSGFEKSLEFDHERKLQLRELIDKIMQETAGALLNEEVKAIKPLWAFINERIVHFHEIIDEHSDLKFYHDNYIEPMKEGLIESSRSMPFVRHLLINMRHATHLLTDIRRQNNQVASNFEDFHTTLKEELDKFLPNTQRVVIYTGK